MKGPEERDRERERERERDRQQTDSEKTGSRQTTHQAAPKSPAERARAAKKR